MPVKKEASSKKATKIKKSVVGNIQTVVVKVGETKKRKRAPRKPRKKPDSGYEVPTRSLPPVVYQIPQMGVSSGTFDSGTPALFRPPPPPTGITIKEPTKITQPILEDIGQVGTEGRVEILSLPSKSETLADLTTPVPSTRSVSTVPSILQTSRSTNETPSLFASSTIPSNIAFGTGTREQNVFDFGMEHVYDQPDNESIISTLTNPTYRHRKNAKIEEPQPPIKSILRPTQQDINLFFQPRKPEKGLLENIQVNEPASTQSTALTSFESPSTSTKTQETQNILLSSPSKKQTNPLTVIELQQQKGKLKRVIRSKSPPKVIEENPQKNIIVGKKVTFKRLVKGTKPPPVEEPTSAGIFA
jgi:hypothetical protein